jgi:hypothetical protein
MLLTLTPGVIFTQEQFGASGFSGTRGWDVNNSYKFNGARAGNGNNVFLLNGSIISNEGSTWEFAPSVDAIQEFNAITTAFDAQYGHEAGGVVNTIIKSGGNKLHGDVYDYLRNRILDANSFQNNFAGLPKGRHNQNQFGGVVGGPIRKDKDFVFGSYEGWQEVVPFPAQGTTVPLDLRNGRNFASHQMTIFDPLTTHACGATSEPGSQSAYWRTPFPCDVIPAINQALQITHQSLGMTNMIHAPTVTTSVFPNININGVSGPLFGSGSITWQPYNSWDIEPNVTWTRGRHSLHAGFTARERFRTRRACHRWL